MLTGLLKYNDSDYSFIFDENVNELQLMPFPESATVTSTVTIKTMGITFGGEKSRMTEPFLIGITNENRKRIVFITIQGDFIKQVNDVLYIRLYAYFMLNSEKNRCY